jgi:AbrB family looped-hinge helix DNA binding protein
MSSLTVKGQVTIPKPIRDALGLKAGDEVDFKINEQGQVILLGPLPTAKNAKKRAPDRFDAVRGKAQVRWRTEQLMALLRA